MKWLWDWHQGFETQQSKELGSSLKSNQRPIQLPVNTVRRSEREFNDSHAWNGVWRCVALTNTTSQHCSSARRYFYFPSLSQTTAWRTVSLRFVYRQMGPPLWSSGQSFWLQIQRARVRFPALPDFLSSSGSGTGSTQPREVNWGTTWIKSSGSGPENRD